jgi:hypothetical protein
MKPARAIVDRDLKPENENGNQDVAIVRHESIDPRRARRLAEVLADILDNASHSGRR